ncbi:ribonuclease H-like domain-containing protein [Tanacetum coccineum]
MSYGTKSPTSGDSNSVSNDFVSCDNSDKSSSVSKLCFVCGSSTHLIKDCDFYEKQMANKTFGNGVGPVHSRNNVNHQNQFVPQAVLLRTGKVNIPPTRPQPVPIGKPKVPAPVPTGRQNRPFPVTIQGVHASRLNAKSLKRDYSNARTLQKNRVVERKNRTLIEAARTMLVDSKLPTMFWTEAVRTACYVLNRVLVTSPHNKTPYALLTGNIPSCQSF